jgi:hypothetical protein
MPARHISLPATFVLVACAGPQGPPPPVPPTTTASPELGGSQPFVAKAGDCDLVVTIEPDKQRFVAGEPVFLSLVVKPLCDKALSVIDGGDYRNRFGRADSFKLTATDAAGKAVPVREVGPVFGGISAPRRLPWKKRMLLAHWFDFTRPGVYAIRVEKDLQIGSGDMSAIERTTPVHVAPTTAIEVLPASHDALGKVIDECAAEVGATDYDKQYEALAKLKMIEDDRVVPVFARVADGQKSTLQIEAVWGIGQYPTDAAVGVLARALANPDLRLVAAQQLAQNKNSKAWEELWALRRDKESNIRLTVLHALARRTTPDVPALLADFEKDPDPIIASEATRYIRERQ